MSEFSIIERVRIENSRSRPRSSVTLATTATRMAGRAAMIENRATIWTWSRAAALPRRRAWTMFQTSRPMMPSSNSTASAFTPSSVTTTSWVGLIGVRPARTTKVANADKQRYEDRRRSEQAGGKSRRFSGPLRGLGSQSISDRRHQLPYTPVAPKAKSATLRRESRL